MMVKTVPVLKGFVSGKFIHVWCPYCKLYHTHGYESDIGEGNRAAHCPVNTPFSKSGYYIKAYSETEVLQLDNRFRLQTNKIELIKQIRTITAEEAGNEIGLVPAKVIAEWIMRGGPQEV